MKIFSSLMVMSVLFSSSLSFAASSGAEVSKKAGENSAVNCAASSDKSVKKPSLAPTGSGDASYEEKSSAKGAK